MLRKEYDPLDSSDLLDLEVQFNKLVDENKTKEPVSIPLDVFGALIEHHATPELYGEQEAELEGLVDELNSVEKERDEFEKKYEDLEEQVEGFEDQVADLQTEVKDLEEQVDNLEG